MRSNAIIQATAALLLASCNPITGGGCTLIGCYDGLVVELPASTVGPVRVEAWSELRIAPQIFECVAGEVCQYAVFPDFQGQNVTVRVTTDAGVHTQEFTGVEYEPQYPNGRRCGAVCEQAILTVQM